MLKKVLLSMVIPLLWIAQSHALTVVATTSQLGDALKNIMGSSGR